MLNAGATPEEATNIDCQKKWLKDQAAKAKHDKLSADQAKESSHSDAQDIAEDNRQRRRKEAC